MQFWDGRFGTLLARFTQHQADVLQLAASPDGNMVFAAGAPRGQAARQPHAAARSPRAGPVWRVSPRNHPGSPTKGAGVGATARPPPPPATLSQLGCAARSLPPPPHAGVDPQLALFHRIPEGGSTAGQPPWAYLSSKRTHSHDVRALCVAAGRHLPEGPCLFSGSNDTRLFMHSVEGFLKVRCCGTPAAAPAARALAAAFPAGAPHAGVLRASALLHHRLWPVLAAHLLAACHAAAPP